MIDVYLDESAWSSTSNPDLPNEVNRANAAENNDIDTHGDRGNKSSDSWSLLTYFRSSIEYFMNIANEVIIVIEPNNIGLLGNGDPNIKII